MTQTHRDGYVLAFDFGLRHIGIACGQTVTGTATPLTTLSARNGTPNWSSVLEVIRPWRPTALVVGLPLNMDDSESDMSARARRFAATLERRSGIPTALVDERLTSRAARELKGDHAVAAVLIAETWLAER